MKINTLILLSIVLPLLHSCGGGNTSSHIEGERLNLNYARNLEITENERGQVFVTIRNPWDTLSNLASYILIDKEAEIPAGLPEEVIVVKTPLEKSVVYSGIHASLIDELGRLNCVKGICDAEYVQDEKIKSKIEEGIITNCGQYNSPNVEQIMALRPDAIMLSPFEGSDISAPVSKLGIPIIYMADYLEQTPLGRAEWMRFYGRLFGEGEKADSLFHSIEQDYIQLQRRASDCKNKPRVLFDRIYSGVWDVPTSGSVTGILIEDAGGSNPFEHYKGRGAAHLSAEEVLMTAGDADIWLIRYTEPILNTSGLSSENKIYSKFKPYKEKRIYGANTLKRPLFEDGAFHPNKVLREMIRILHPELENSTPEYYHSIE